MLTAWYSHWRTIVDANLETSRTPLDQIECRFCLERSNCRVAVSGNDITTVEESHGHVFALGWITNHHLVGRFCALAGELIDLEALMGRLLLANDRSIADQRIVDTWIWNEVRLELVEVNIQGAVKAQTGGDRRHYLSNESIEMLKVRARDIEIAATDFEDGFIVDQEGAVGVLDCAVSRQNRVVWFDDGSGNSRGRVHGEFQFRFLAEVC